jgi:hypothetical protein
MWKSSAPTDPPTRQQTKKARKISLRPDYDPFFYRQLSRRIFLFRSEYIFEPEKAVVVEMPQLGHAT